MDLTVTAGGVSLSTPLLPASGTFGWGYENADFVDYSAIGGIVTKSVSLRPKQGNPPPRLYEIPCGLINSIGLQNPGVEELIRVHGPAIEKIRKPVIVSIFGETAEEYAMVAERLSPVSWVTALELNLSCPNVHAGGLEFGSDPELVRVIIREVKTVIEKPVWVKFSHSTHMKALVEAALNEGAHGVVLINTLPALVIDVEKRRAVLGGKKGGMSGPPLKYVALRDVWEIYSTFKCSVIGVGGISRPEDVAEFIIAGASAVEIGSSAMVNPSLFKECASYLREYMLRHNLNSLEDLRGSMG